MKFADLLNGSDDDLGDDDEFKPGQLVHTSGIYTVTHDTNHVQPHDVTCVQGNRFPTCRGCEHPRFVLKTAAVHVADHPEFFKPAPGAR